MRKSKEQIEEEKREIQEIKEIRKTQKLLKHFDLTAYAFNPGVRCFLEGHGDNYIDFDGDTWEFVEPLLKELVKYRKKYGIHTSKWKASKSSRNVL